MLTATVTQTRISELSIPKDQHCSCVLLSTRSLVLSDQDKLLAAPCRILLTSEDTTKAVPWGGVLGNTFVFKKKRRRKGRFAHENTPLPLAPGLGIRKAAGDTSWIPGTGRRKCANYPRVSAEVKERVGWNRNSIDFRAGDTRLPDRQEPSPRQRSPLMVTDSAPTRRAGCPGIEDKLPSVA